MAKESSYWEGWGFSDRIPMYFSATKRNIEKLLAELKKTYPKNPVEQVNPRVLQVMATDNDVKNMKRIATLFNAQLVYAEGGQLEGLSIADANPYIAGAKSAKQILPNSVDAIDFKIASKINPDPNRPIFFSKGGNISDKKILESYKKAVTDYIKERYNEKVDWQNSFILINKTNQGIKITNSEVQTESGKEYKINPKELFDSYSKGGLTLTWKNKYNKKFGYSKDEPHDLSEISKDTGVSIKGLQQIYNKGIGAYKTNPQSVRPNVKSKEQWAMARVYSAIMGGKASKVDSNELLMSQGGVAPTIGGTMETSMTDAPMIGGTMASSLFENGGTTGEVTVAKIILEQLGGINKLVVMTGAYNFVALPNGIYFKIKNRKVNYVKIRLNEKDLYEVIFGKIVSGKVKLQSEHFDIYFDELKPLFEKETGMYLNF